MSTFAALLVLCLAVLSTARIVKPPSRASRHYETQDARDKRYFNIFDDLSDDGYAAADADSKDDDGGDEERALRSLLKDRRGYCKELGSECTGLRPCCGSSVCYWPEGYSIKTGGRCVTCVSANQICQRDAQCCSGLICQKSSTWVTDGTCGPKRAQGQECHDNDQCLSDYCNISWISNVRGHGGFCDAQRS